MSEDLDWDASWLPDWISEPPPPSPPPPVRSPPVRSRTALPTRVLVAAVTAAVVVLGLSFASTRIQPDSRSQSAEAAATLDASTPGRPLTVPVALNPGDITADPSATAERTPFDLPALAVAADLGALLELAEEQAPRPPTTGTTTSLKAPALLPLVSRPTGTTSATDLADSTGTTQTPEVPEPPETTSTADPIPSADPSPSADPIPTAESSPSAESSPTAESSPSTGSTTTAADPATSTSTSVSPPATSAPAMPD